MSPAAPTRPETVRQDRAFFVFNAVVSVVALSVLTWLLVFRRAHDRHWRGPLLRLL